MAVSLLPIGAFLALGLAWLVVDRRVCVVARLGPLRPARRAFLAAAVPARRPAADLHPVRGPARQRSRSARSTLTISGEGLGAFTTIALKSWVSVQAALLLAFTTPFHDLVDGLRQLRLPRIMVAIISFMYRYLGVLSDEATRMARARASRSADARDGRGGGVDPAGGRA